MAATSRVIDRDLGWNRIKRELSRTKDQAFVKVGVQGAQAMEVREGGINMATVATVHEFGTAIDHPGAWQTGSARAGSFVGGEGYTIIIPERSFIRATIDAKANEYRKLVKNLGMRVATGKLSRRKALAIFGLRVEADIRRRIQAGIDPPNAPSTIARKKSSKPLIDHGHLIRAITSVVEGL